MSTATAAKTNLHGLKCSTSGAASVLKITNLNQINMQIFQVGTDCLETLLGTMRPNIFTSISSKVGFVYFTKTATDNDISSFTVQSTSASWTIDAIPGNLVADEINKTTTSIRTTTMIIKSVSTAVPLILPAPNITTIYNNTVEQSTNNPDNKPYTTYSSSNSVPTVIANGANMISSSGSVNENSIFNVVTKQPLIFGVAMGLAVCCIIAIIATALYVRKVRRETRTKGNMYKVFSKNDSSKFYKNESSSTLNLVFKSSPTISSTNSKKIPYISPNAIEANNQSLSRSGSQKNFNSPDVVLQRDNSNQQQLSRSSPIQIPIPPPQNFVLSNMESVSNPEQKPSNKFDRLQPPQRSNLEPNVTIEELLSILAPIRSHSISTASILLDKQRSMVYSDSDKQRSTILSDLDKQRNTMFSQRSTMISEVNRDRSSGFASVVVFDESAAEIDESAEVENKVIENDGPVVPVPEGLRVAKIYRSAFTYEKDRLDELSLKFADMVLVEEIFDDGWCSVLLVQPPERRGMKGLIPWKCLEMPMHKAA
ncbi:hypothetical protein HK096_007950 [Nowakowskiella sp. JEL0078]|nr:hypothetical protein HK096_007950 [Nowakowskiella sp. JEL0078]